MTTQPPIPLSLKERWQEYLAMTTLDLRGLLIEAVSLHEGWEESAISLVDEAIMPVLKGNYRAPDTSLIAVIKEFGQDRYWQPGWAEELAERIASMGGVPLGLPSAEPTGAITAGVWNAGAITSSGSSESASIGHRVMYEDGTPSREYEEQPSETPSLLPCPFCGSKNVALDEWSMNNDSVQCNICWAWGPITKEFDGGELAIEKWNVRATVTVMVDAAACGRALRAESGNGSIGSKQYYTNLAIAVLRAAKEQGAKFDYVD